MLTCEDMISSHVKISMISVISRLSLKWYLNSLVYHRNIFGSPSKVLGNLRKSSDIFGNFWKLSENVRERSSGLRNNFGESSEIFGKWSEIFGKSSKIPSSVCLYNKKNITRQLEDMNFMFSWQEQYLTRSLRSLVRYCSRHSNIKFISSRHRVISSIYHRQQTHVTSGLCILFQNDNINFFPICISSCFANLHLESFRAFQMSYFYSPL